MHVKHSADGFDLSIDGKALLTPPPRRRMHIRGLRDRADGDVSRQFRHRGHSRIANSAAPRSDLVRRERLERRSVGSTRRRTSANALDQRQRCRGRHHVHRPRSAAKPPVASVPWRARRACVRRRRADVLSRSCRPAVSTVDLGAGRRARQGKPDHLRGRPNRAGRRATITPPTIRSRPISPRATTRVHVETTAYSVFDFRRPAFHEIEVWEIPSRVAFHSASSMAGLVTALSNRFGRQPPLPDWAMDGAIVGLKDGERSFDRLETYIAAGAVVSGPGGARTGSACARRPSANACSGTGRASEAPVPRD